MMRWWATKRAIRCCRRMLWPGTPMTKSSGACREDRSAQRNVMFESVGEWPRHKGSPALLCLLLGLRCLSLCTWTGWSRRFRSAGRTWNQLKGFWTSALAGLQSPSLAVGTIRWEWGAGCVSSTHLSINTSPVFEYSLSSCRFRGDLCATADFYCVFPQPASV